jgi:hypothetical protein
MNRLEVRRSWLLALLFGLLSAGLPMAAFAQTTDDGSGAAAIFTLICTCFIMIIGLVIPIGLAYWVYKDAQKMANPNAVLWAVLTFFTTLLGLILYLLIGRNQTTAGGAPPTGPAGPSAPPSDPSNTVRY